MRMIRVCLCVAVVAVLAAGARADFKAGAAFRVVTPDPLLPVSGGVGKPNPATIKNDELTVRAAVFEKDGERVAFVGTDFLGFSAVLGNKARAKIKGIPGDHVLIGCTHTHSAPDTYAFPDEQGNHGADLKYLDWVCDKVAEAVNEAVKNLQPAELKIATGEAKGQIAYNYYAPDLYDPRCNVIQAIATKGQRHGAKKGGVIVTVVNYAIHPEVIGNDRGMEGPDLVGILLGEHRTGRIEQGTAGGQLGPEGIQQPGLELGQLGNVLGPAQGLDVRMAANHARAGAGGIQQNAVELALRPPLFRCRGIAVDHFGGQADAIQVLLHPLEAVLVGIDGDLVVVGSGDPSIEDWDGSASALFARWAADLKARGIRAINGRIHTPALDDMHPPLPEAELAGLRRWLQEGTPWAA